MQINARQYPNAEKFHDKIIKMPTFYGPERMKYAENYANAIEKVIEHLDELK